MIFDTLAGFRPATFLSVAGGSIPVSGLLTGLSQFVLDALGMGPVSLVLTVAIFTAGVSTCLRALLPFVEPAGAVVMLVHDRSDFGTRRLLVLDAGPPPSLRIPSALLRTGALVLVHPPPL